MIIPQAAFDLAGVPGEATERQDSLLGRKSSRESSARTLESADVARGEIARSVATARGSAAARASARESADESSYENVVRFRCGPLVDELPRFSPWSSPRASYPFLPLCPPTLSPTEDALAVLQRQQQPPGYHPSTRANPGRLLKSSRGIVGPIIALLLELYMFRSSKLCWSQPASQPAGRSVSRPVDWTIERTGTRRDTESDGVEEVGRWRNSTPALAAPPTTLSPSSSSSSAYPLSLRSWAENAPVSFERVLLSRILTSAGNAIPRRFYRRETSGLSFSLSSLNS